MEFKSSEELIARVESTLKSYKASGLLDSGDFYRWIKEVLMKLNIPAYVPMEAILKVRNYGVNLPDDFQTLWALWRYDAGEQTSTFSELQQHNRFYYFKTDQDLCKTDECDTDCKVDFQESGDIRVTKVYLNGEKTTHSFCNRKPIRVINKVTSSCDPEAPVVSRAEDHEATLSDRRLTFNFEQGFVHLQYYGFLVDEDGLPMIPDQVQIELAIENYIIYKFFVEQYYNVTLEAAQKLKTAKELYNESYAQAIAWVKLPSVRSMLDMISKRARRFGRYEQDYSRR